MSTQEYIRSVTEIVPDDFPTLTPLPEGATSASTNGTSFMSYFANVTWQTWVIIILILALLGINIFSHFFTCPLMFLEISKPKGTTSVVWIINVFYFIFTREIQ